MTDLESGTDPNALRLTDPGGDRRSWRLGLAAALIIVLLGVAALPMATRGSEVERGSEVTIAANRTLTEDAYLVGGEVEFEGNAERDVMVAAGRYSQGGTIGGSLNLAAGEAEITGQVDGSLRVSGGTLDLRGQVGGDLIVIGGDVTIPSQARIRGNLILVGGQVDLRGTVDGDITGYAGRLTLNGATNGRVNVTVGDLEVLSAARIEGELRYVSMRKGDISDGAEIGGGIDRVLAAPWEGAFEDGGFFGPLSRLLRLLVVGAALAILTPRLALRIEDNAQRTPIAFGVGVLGVFAIPVVAIVLLVSVVGFSLGWIVLMLLPVALYLSQIAAGLAIGGWILPNRWNDGSRGYGLLAMVLGVILIGVVKLIPLAYVSGIVGLVVSLWGLGAVLMLITRVWRSPAPVGQSGPSEEVAPAG